MTSTAYTKNSPEELEALRELLRQPMIERQAAMRIEQTRADCYQRIENLKNLAAELVDLLDVLDESQKDHLQVDTRRLAGRLRLAEVELDAAVSTLAQQLGLVDAGATAK